MMNGKEIWELVKQINPTETLPEEVCFLLEELGDISKGIMYGKILKDDPESKNSYDIELKRAFGDMIIQLKLLIHRCGFSWIECEMLGESALVERIERLKEKNWIRK